jgi:gas vesicle protein
MTRDAKTIGATLVGAVIGSLAAYLFFTDEGRRMRRAIEPALEDLSRELNSFRVTVQKTAEVAVEGWKLLNEALGEANRPAPRYPTPHQSSPF